MMSELMIPAGRLQVATPLTIAESIRDDTEATEAVDERVQAVAAAIIAADPTLGAAAALKVAEAIVAEGLIRETSPRLERVAPYQGVTRAGVDKIWVPDALVLGEDGWFLPWVEEKLRSRIGSAVTGTDVLVAAGQSNIAFSTLRTVPAGTYSEDRDILVWNGETLSIMPATYASAMAGLAREYRRRNPQRRVVIVNGAVGSTAFSSTTVNPPPAGFAYAPDTPTWTRTLTEDTQNLALRLNVWVKTLMSNHPDFNIAGFVYAGSEGDIGRRDGAQLAALLDDLFGWYRSEWGVTFPVALLQRVPEWERDRPTPGGEYMQPTGDAMAATGSRIFRAAWSGVPFGFAIKNDLVHYAASSIPERGMLLADALERARGNLAGADVTTPRNAKVERAANVATATWTHPPGRLQGATFDVQTSVDAGATWQAVTLRHPLQPSVSVTNAGRVRFRVRTLHPTDSTAHSDYLYVEG